jgi:hypothetical protein
MTQNKQKIINEIVELIRNFSMDEDNEDYTAGYNDAVDDILTVIEDFYE